MREIRCRGMREDGNWIYGYYIKHLTRQIAPVGDRLSEDEVVHLIAFDGFADWNMPKNIEFAKVIPKTVGEYVEILNAYEGDLLYGEDTDEYGSLLSNWQGVIKFNDKNGRLMMQETYPGDGEWYELDDYLFDRVSGNIHEIDDKHPDTLKQLKGWIE